MALIAARLTQSINYLALKETVSMKKNFVLAVFISALLTGGSLAMAKSTGQEESANEAKLAKQAKITKEQAQEIALKRAPGTVESGELEREHGKLVYSFDIRNAKGHHRRGSGQRDNWKKSCASSTRTRSRKRPKSGKRPRKRRIKVNHNKCQSGCER